MYKSNIPEIGTYLTFNRLNCRNREGIDDRY